MEVMTGLMLACLERASMHSSLLILKMMHSSIRRCTCIHIYIYIYIYIDHVYS